jgi:hypothetical protein
MNQDDIGVVVIDFFPQWYMGDKIRDIAFAVPFVVFLRMGASLR